MKPYDSFDESYLLEAFQVKGDTKAFEEIYRRFWFKLYSWAYARTSSRQESEEMVQIIFERLWKNRRSSQIRNIGAYLAVSLRHALYDVQRKQKQAKTFNQEQTGGGASNTTEEELNRKLLLENLEKALQSMSPKTQTVFRMSRYDNKTIAEIATHLSLTEKAVEYHITKALKLLRHRLKGFLHFFL